MIRIGQSTDIHRLVENRDLILGGVKIENDLGLLGHSDADCLLHAIAEAILGALALGDLGKYFPDNTEEFSGVSSLLILNEVNKMMKQKGFKIGNIDALILIEKPKMAPYIEKMRKNIAQALETSIGNISVKATRGEKLGFVGHSEGVVSQAVVLLESID
jgi:2-C-methyl-D-erythritol 2,4-cyclodiphosphate synthase